MNATFEFEQQLKEEAIAIFGRYLPPRKVARLLALWQFGKGDYVQERDATFAGETVDSLFELAAGAQAK